MEPIAVNSIEITRELFNEAAREPLRRKYNALTIKMAGALALLLLILFLITRLFDGDPVLLLGELAVLAAATLWIRFSLPRSERKRVWQSMSKNGPPHRTVAFYEDRFVVTGAEERTISYGEALSARSTERLYIIALEGGGEVLLDRDGFSSGSWEAVRPLLRG